MAFQSSGGPWALGSGQGLSLSQGLRALGPGPKVLRSLWASGIGTMGHGDILGQVAETTSVDCSWGIASAEFPLKEELMASPSISPCLQAELAQWLKEMQTKVLHEEGLLPRKTEYDVLCGHTCKVINSRGVSLAENFSALLSKSAEVTSLWLIIAERASGTRTRGIHMVALRQHMAKRPGGTEVVFAEVLADTTPLEDIQNRRNLPWNLELALEPDPRSGKYSLLFTTDVEMFHELSWAPAADEVLDVIAVQCHYRPVSLQKLVVSRTGEPVSLKSYVLEELVALKAGGGEGDDEGDLFSDMRDVSDAPMARRGRGRGRGGGKGSSKGVGRGAGGGPADALDAAEEGGPDLPPEAVELLEAMRETEAVEDLECCDMEDIQETSDSDVGLGLDVPSPAGSDCDVAEVAAAAPPASNSSASTAAPPAAAGPEGVGGGKGRARGRGRGRAKSAAAKPKAKAAISRIRPDAGEVINDASLDAFVVPVGKIYHVKDEYGRKVGELHPRSHSTYVVSAKCECERHTESERCSRTRGWKAGQEPLNAVQRVLVKWLHEGHLAGTADEHMSQPRA